MTVPAEGDGLGDDPTESHGLLTIDWGRGNYMSRWLAFSTAALARPPQLTARNGKCDTQFGTCF